MPADFYDLLGVDDDASADDVKSAFRDRAREYHPDVNDHPQAQQQFKTLNEAYEILSNSKDRARYDRLGHRKYVDQHLDGLPTMGTPGAPDETDQQDDESGATGDDRAGMTGTERDEPSNATAASGSSQSSGRSGSASSRSTRSTTNTTSTNATATNATSSNATSTNRTSTNATSTNATSTTSTTTGSGTAGSTTAGSRTATSTSTTSRSNRSTGGRRTGLRRGWIASVVALGLYLAGLAGYLLTGGGREALALVRADPLPSLLASTPLSEPLPLLLAAGRSLAAGGLPDPIVVFAVGVVALPLTVGVTVGRYGRGSAYLYPVAMILPLVYVAVRVAVSLPLAADAVFLAISPVGAALVFTIDTGRYLFAS